MKEHIDSVKSLHKLGALSGSWNSQQFFAKDAPHSYSQVARGGSGAAPSEEAVAGTLIPTLPDREGEQPPKYRKPEPAAELPKPPAEAEIESPLHTLP